MTELRDAVWRAIQSWAVADSELDIELRASEVDAALDAFAQHRRADDWQPIETAPRDGTVVLGCIKSHAREVEPAEWDIYVCWWTEANPGAFKQSGWMSDSCVDFGGHEYPTHWRPLPKGPGDE